MFADINDYDDDVDQILTVKVTSFDGCCGIPVLNKALCKVDDSMLDSQAVLQLPLNNLKKKVKRKK